VKGQRRAGIQVIHEGKTYTFPSKKGARAAMRRLLGTKKLPPNISEQIGGSRGRRGPRNQPKKGNTMANKSTNGLELTKSQLDAIAKSMAGGATLIEEATKLGLKRGKQLRVALQEHLGEEKYKGLVGRKAAAPKKAAGKKGKKAAAKKGAPKKKAAKKGGAKKKKVVQKPGSPEPAAQDEAAAAS
jgi:hypothetical protein